MTIVFERVDDVAILDSEGANLAYQRSSAAVAQLLPNLQGRSFLE
jgi:hypothetical protein